MTKADIIQIYERISLLLLDNKWAELEKILVPLVSNSQVLPKDEVDNFRYNLGEVYLFINRVDEAEKMLMQMDPSSLLYKDLQYRCHIAKEEFETAIREINELIPAQSLSPCYFYDRAFCYAKIGDINSAFQDYCSEYLLLDEDPNPNRPIADYSLFHSFDRRRVILETMDYFSQCAVAPFSVYMLMGEVLVPSNSSLPYLETVHLISDFLLLFKYQFLQSGGEVKTDPVLLYQLGGAVDTYQYLSTYELSEMSPQSLYYYSRSMQCFSPELQDEIDMDGHISSVKQEILTRNKTQMKSIDLYYCGLFFFTFGEANRALTFFDLAQKSAKTKLKKGLSVEEDLVNFYADKMHRFVKLEEAHYIGYDSEHTLRAMPIKIDEIGLSQFQWYLFENETLFFGNNVHMDPIEPIWEYYYLTQDDRKRIIETIRFDRALAIRDQISQTATNSCKENSQIKNDNLKQFIDNIEDLPKDRVEERVSSAIDAEYYKGKELSMLLEYLLFRGKISIEQWIALSLYSANDDNAQLILSLLGSGLGIFTIIPALISFVISISANLLRKDKSPNDYPEYKKHVHEVLNDVFCKSDDRLIFEDSCPSEETIKQFFHLRDNQKR